MQLQINKKEYSLSKYAVNLARLMVSFDTELIKNISEEIKEMYENNLKRGFGADNLIEIKLASVGNIPLLFYEGERYRTINRVRYRKIGDKEHYCILNKEGKSGDFAFSYDPKHSVCLLYFSENLSLDKLLLRYLFNGLCDKLLYSAILSHNRGFLVHSAGIVSKNGKGILICGYSGEGKSTIAKRFDKAGYHVMNDDCMIVRQEQNDFYIFSSPWKWNGRPQAYPDGVPLDCIIFLTKKRVGPSEVKVLSKRETFFKIQEHLQFNLPIKERKILIYQISEELSNNLKAFELFHSLEDKSNPIELIENNKI